MLNSKIEIKPGQLYFQNFYKVLWLVLSVHQFIDEDCLRLKILFIVNGRVEKIDPIQETSNTPHKLEELFNLKHIC